MNNMIYICHLIFEWRFFFSIHFNFFKYLIHKLLKERNENAFLLGRFYSNKAILQ